MFAYDVPFEVLERRPHAGQERAWASASSAADGEPVDFVTSAVRNLLRIVDFLPLFYLVGSVSIVCDAARTSGSATSPAARSSHARPLRRTRRRPTPVAPVSVPLEQVLTWDVSAVDAEESGCCGTSSTAASYLPWPIRSYFAGQLLDRFWAEGSGAPA